MARSAASCSSATVPCGRSTTTIRIIKSSERPYGALVIYAVMPSCCHRPCCLLLSQCLPLIVLEGVLEGVGDLLGVLAAGLGEVGPAAAAAADDRGDLLEPVARVQAARRPGRGDRPATSWTLPSAAVTSSTARPVLGLAPQDVDQLRASRRATWSSTAWTTTVASPTDVAPASRSSAETFAPASARRWDACFLRVLISSSRAATRSPTWPWGTRERRGDLGQDLFFLADVVERGLAGQRGDPARAGGDRLLADDLEQAHLADIVQVRAAAELPARTRPSAPRGRCPDTSRRRGPWRPAPSASAIGMCVQVDRPRRS